MRGTGVKYRGIRLKTVPGGIHPGGIPRGKRIFEELLSLEQKSRVLGTKDRVSSRNTFPSVLTGSPFVSQTPTHSGTHTNRPVCEI